MNKDTYAMIDRLRQVGISSDDAWALRRIAMTLHNWHEQECGTDGGCIERDEITDKPYWLNSHTMRRTPIADREKGALKRLNRDIMPKYLGLWAYVQGDPRGASLYVGSYEQVPGFDSNPDSLYSRGIAVYK